MELRKLQITGGSTHVISLPKKWIDRNRLGRSQTIAIHEEPDGSLLLIPHGEEKAAPRALTVELPDLPGNEEVVRRIVGAYLAGADEIHVKSSGRMDARVRQAVRDVCRTLVGVEIVEETANAFVLHDLVGVADMDLRKSLTRMQRIARLMHDDAAKAFEARDAGMAADVSKRDDELDRLLWMVSKQMHALLEQPRLAARLAARPAEALNLFLAARCLERMGDHAAKIASNVLLLQGHKLPAQVVESIVQHSHAVRAIWDDAFSSLKRPDFALAMKAADAGEAASKWRGEFSGQLGNLGPEVVGPLTLIADSIDRTRGYAIDIAETAMNQTYQKVA